ncbi:MAG: hypothetical protein MI802_19885, partial [Desulfobacterales bacterium]|nr:hypothetical protein [Desulfobacterales bacterium]
EGLFADQERFPEFLRQCISRFISGKKNVEIWSALPAASVKIKHLIIPNLPAGKISKAVYWGLMKEGEFDEKNDRYDFRLLGDISENGVKKKRVLAFSTPSAAIDSQIALFKKAGYPLAGLTAIPFAVKNLMGTGQINDAEPHIAVVNIHRQTSDIFCFSNRELKLIRSLRAGSSALFEQVDTTADQDPIDYLSLLSEPDFSLCPEIQEPSERLVGKISRTGDYFTQNYTENTPLNRYIFYGDVDRCIPFISLANTVIHSQVSIFQPVPKYCPERLPRHTGQRGEALTAYGVALSVKKSTPDFLFTHVHRSEVKAKIRLLMLSVCVALICVASAAGVHAYLSTKIADHQKRLNQISERREKLGSIPTKARIQKNIDGAEAIIGKTGNYVTDYKILAVIGEICSNTPDHIKLTHLRYNKIDAEDPSATETYQLEIRGVVSAHDFELDSSLGKYMLSLTNSPVFGPVKLADQKRSGNSGTDDRKRMKFKALLEVQ